MQMPNLAKCLICSWVGFVKYFKFLPGSHWNGKTPYPLQQISMSTQYHCPKKAIFLKYTLLSMHIFSASILR